MTVYTDLKNEFKAELKKRGMSMLKDKLRMNTYGVKFQVMDSAKAREIGQLFLKKDYDSLLSAFGLKEPAPSPSPEQRDEEEKKAIMSDKKKKGKRKADAEEKAKAAPAPSPEQRDEMEKKAKETTDQAKKEADAAKKINALIRKKGKSAGQKYNEQLDKARTAAKKAAAETKAKQEEAEEKERIAKEQKEAEAKRIAKRMAEKAEAEAEKAKKEAEKAKAEAESIAKEQKKREEMSKQEDANKPKENTEAEAKEKQEGMDAEDSDVEEVIDVDNTKEEKAEEIDLQKVAGDFDPSPTVHNQGSETVSDTTDVMNELKAEGMTEKEGSKLKSILDSVNMKNVYTKLVGMIVSGVSGAHMADALVASTGIGFGPTAIAGIGITYIIFEAFRAFVGKVEEADVYGFGDSFKKLGDELKGRGANKLAELVYGLAEVSTTGNKKVFDISKDADDLSRYFHPDMEKFYKVYASMSRIEQLEINMALGKQIGDVFGMENIMKDEEYLALPENFRKNVARTLLTLDEHLSDMRYGPAFLEDVFREALEEVRTSRNPDIPEWVNLPEPDVKREFRELIDARVRGTVSALEYRSSTGAVKPFDLTEDQFTEQIRLFLQKYPTLALDPRVTKLWRTNGLRYDPAQQKFMVDRLTVAKDFQKYDIDALMGEGSSNVPNEFDMAEFEKFLSQPTQGENVPIYNPSAPGMDQMNFGKPDEEPPQKLVPTDEITGERLDTDGKALPKAEVPEMLQRTGGSTNPFTSIALSQILLDVLRMDKKETQRVSKGLSEMYGKELPLVQQLQSMMTQKGTDETASRRGLYQMMRAVQNYEVKDSVGAIGYLQKKPEASSALSASVANMAGTMAGGMAKEGIKMASDTLGKLMSNDGAPPVPSELGDLNLKMGQDGRLTPESIEQLKTITAGMNEDRRLQAGAIAAKATEYAVKFVMYHQMQALQKGIYSGNFINNTKQSIENISSLATYGQEGGKNFMDVLSDTGSNLASGNVSGIMEDWSNTFSSVGYALWDTNKSGVLQKLEGGIKARQKKLADRQKAARDHNKRMGTYYTNSGMTSFHRRGIPHHNIVAPPESSKPFQTLADPKPLVNRTYQNLRVLDTKAEGPPTGFKIKT